MRALYGAAAAVAFLLELCALAALAYWGATVTTGAAAVALAVVVPLGAAILWGTVAAPKARVQLATPAKVAVRSAVLLGAALALAAAGRPLLALAFAIAIAVDSAVLAALGEPVAGA